MRFSTHSCIYSSVPGAIPVTDVKQSPSASLLLDAHLVLVFVSQLYPTKATSKRKDASWFMIHGDTIHYGPADVMPECEATGHIVSTVRKQSEINAGTQLTFSFTPV